MDFIDVVRAYLRTKARRRAYVDLPKADQQDGTRGRLEAMYGTRGAAQNWELEYIEMMIAAGFTQGS